MSDLVFKTRDALVELKNKVELMLDLAYSAVMLHDEKIAKEVLKLEEYFDWLCTHFQLLVLSIFQEEGSKNEILGLIRFSVSLEAMADAAARIAETVVRGLKTGYGLKVFSMVSEESEEFVSVAKISSKSRLAGKTLKETGIEEKLDIQILAVRRRDKWYFDPPKDFKLEAGDVIIVRGYAEALDDIKREAYGD